MACEPTHKLRRVELQMHLRSLVQHARRAAERPNGSWTEIERPKAVAEIKHLSTMHGQDSVLEVLFEGFADMVFTETKWLERSGCARHCNRRIEELAEAWHQANLKKVASR